MVIDYIEAKIVSKSSIVVEDEDEWKDSEVGSSESEVELDDSDSSGSEKKTQKKRKFKNSKSEKTSSKKLFSDAHSPSLPPRPSKNVGGETPKGYSQYTASTPSPLKSRNLISPTPMTPNSPSPSKNSGVDAPHPVTEELGDVGGYGSHEHHSWDFLHKNRKDKSGRSPDHPDFNPRTISFPASFLKEQTPAMKQWCEVKADNFDTILFFKVNATALI